MTAPRRRSGLTVDAILRRCEGKKRYPDELTCNAAGLHYIEIGQIDKLWRYKCKLCGGGWHLTKLDNGPRNAIHLLGESSGCEQTKRLHKFSRTSGSNLCNEEGAVGRPGVQSTDDGVAGVETKSNEEAVSEMRHGETN